MFSQLINLLAQPVTPIIVLVIMFIVYILCHIPMPCFDRKLGFDSLIYWDKRYEIHANKSIPVFEWYYVDGIEAIIEKTLQLKATSPILELGCGQSNLSERIYACGYRNIIATDFSEVCIRQRQRKQISNNITYKVADASNMIGFNSQMFELIVEKATFDSIIFKKDKTAMKTATKVMNEIVRLLKPKGYLLSISHCPKETWTTYWSHKNIVLIDVQINAKPCPDKSVGLMNVYHYLCVRIK